MSFKHNTHHSRKWKYNLPHVPIHEENHVVYVRKYEEKENRAEEHCHPRPVILSKHF